jgi:hypothetical protein
MRDAAWSRFGAEWPYARACYSSAYPVSTEIIDEVDAELERGVETEPEAELSTGVLNSLSTTHGRIVRR